MFWLLVIALVIAVGVYLVNIGEYWNIGDYKFDTEAGGFALIAFGVVIGVGKCILWVMA